jgi:hypothetical protein
MTDAETKYRVRLPDGQVFETTNLAWVKKEHPQAHIEGRIVPDAHGIGVLAPYQGEQPYDAAERRAAEAQTAEQAEQQRAAYEGMTVAELRSALASRGVETGATAKKADLIEALVNADLHGLTEGQTEPMDQAPQDAEAAEAPV